MVKRCAQPRGGRVAGVALGSGRHVVYAFAARRDTVVTRGTRSQNLRVINLLNRPPQQNGMACFT